MKASEAKTISNERNIKFTQQDEEAYNEIIKRIKTSAEMGHYSNSVFISTSNNLILKSRLEALGYKIVINGGSLLISWK